MLGRLVGLVNRFLDDRTGGGGSFRGFLLLLVQLLLLLFEPDFFLERALQLVRRPLEFRDALAEGPAKLRKLSRAKNYQSDHEDDDQLGHAEGTKHGRTPVQSIIRNRRPIWSRSSRGSSAPKSLHVRKLSVNIRNICAATILYPL